MPLAAFTMASLLFVYTRTSIRSAKANAQRHREADGGQINWANETRRRHGLVAGVEEGGTSEGNKGKGRTRTEAEVRLREAVVKD
jgi:hypothetical protein